MVVFDSRGWTGRDPYGSTFVWLGPVGYLTIGWLDCQQAWGITGGLLRKSEIVEGGRMFRWDFTWIWRNGTWRW